MKTIKSLAKWTKYTSDRAIAITPGVALLMALTEREFAWWLPTETVVRTPRHVVPEMAYAYRVFPHDVRNLTGMPLEEWPDRLVTKHDTFVSTSMNFAYLVEEHSECGDDGHTDCRISSWVLLRSTDYEEYRAYMTRSNEAERYTITDHIYIE